MTNGDFLEAAEYFARQGDTLAPVDYRHHWAKAERAQIRRRWDNTPDHPEVSTFPHHCHVGREENVVASEPLSILGVIALIERILDSESQSE